MYSSEAAQQSHPRVHPYKTMSPSSPGRMKHGVLDVDLHLSNLFSQTGFQLPLVYCFGGQPSCFLPDISYFPWDVAAMELISALVLQTAHKLISVFSFISLPVLSSYFSDPSFLLGLAGQV